MYEFIGKSAMSPEESHASAGAEEQDRLVFLNDMFLSIVPGYRVVNATELARRDVAIRMVHFLALLGYFDNDDDFGVDRQFPDARSYSRTDGDAVALVKSDDGVSLREDLEDGDYEASKRVLDWLERRLGMSPQCSLLCLLCYKVYVCMYVCMHVCMYACMYVCFALGTPVTRMTQRVAYLILINQHKIRDRASQRSTQPTIQIHPPTHTQIQSICDDSSCLPNAF
jgi:hypothetical protein